MPPFPLDSLKAGTLRSICKDLGVNLGTKRKREDMVALLKDVETKGLSSPVSNDTLAGPKPVTKLPSHDQREGSEEFEMDTGDGPVSSCHCADGWLSPRMKFILSMVAVISSDLVRDTAIDGDIEGVYMTQYIPVEELPRGKKLFVPWVKGFSALFLVIHKIFEAGHIPTEVALLETLDNFPQYRILIDAYARHTQFEYGLSALVREAKAEWERDFQEIHCGEDSGWNGLVACTKHDFDWILAEDMLTQ